MSNEFFNDIFGIMYEKMAEEEMSHQDWGMNFSAYLNSKDKFNWVAKFLGMPKSTI